MRHLSNGFDRAARVPAVREMSIEAALHWAFGRECASLEFDELAETAHGQRVGVDGIWLMMQRAQIGCRVDGGGHSDPAWDAQVIASQLAALPPAQGGRGMAVAVASHARAGTRPDWMPDARVRCVPVDWRLTKHGRFARTEVVARVETVHRGRRSTREVVACPVTYSPSAAQIASARRHYLDWCGALIWLASELRALDILSTVRITADMPPPSPWRAGR